MRGRPRSLEENKNTERMLFTVTVQLKDAIFDYYMERLTQNRDINFGMANAMRELLTIGLEAYNSDKGKHNA